jgi:cellulose synthase operon protein C
MNHRPMVLVCASALLLTACSSVRKNDSPTIKSLEGKNVYIESDADIPGGRRKALQGYREFLDTVPQDTRRLEAMRRLGDLTMEQTEERQLKQAEASSPAKGVWSTQDYRHVIRLYDNLLRAYPKHPDNDRVLYQLGKAYEYVGEPHRALETLDRLVADYPSSAHRDEVQFRRGELLFVMKSYDSAESAYQAVLDEGDASEFYERALYKHGWARFKQVHYEKGLDSFFAVLDRKLIGRYPGEGEIADISFLTRGEKELLDDTFRVISLSFSYLDGPKSINRFLSQARPRDYEFRVYRHLGDLYLKQERIRDAAETFNAFARRHPEHVQAPLFQVRVIEAYKQAGFASLVLETKKEFVLRYGIGSEYHKRHQSAGGYDRILPHLKANLDDLARHFHASAQKTKQSTDYQEAARWYRIFLSSFPHDPQAPDMNFLLADILFEDKRYLEAVMEYEQTAYRYPRHAKSADAGYAALLAYAEQEKRLPVDQRVEWRRRTVASSLRFADANPEDKRAPAVLTKAAEQLYAMHDPEAAGAIAKRVIARGALVEAPLRRTAWTVVAHAEFEKGAFDRAEKSYREVLTLSPSDDKERAALTERVASSIYKQGEQLRATGDVRGAIAHFLRVGKSAPASPIRATAEYDAAAGLIELKDWNEAARVLEHFRRSYPGHALQPEVGNKLALCYVESGQLHKAAAEFEHLASTKKDPRVRREALWQAAALYEKANQQNRAIQTYARYVKEFPQPLEPAMEARLRLTQFYAQKGKPTLQRQWLQDMIYAEKRGGRERTERTRFLAAQAALTLAEPAYEDFRTVRLVEPLKKSLKTKKQKMELAIKAFGVAADYGVADFATASTYRIADIYAEFGRALLKSQRPKGLSAEALEQYNVMLEEQAYPFEEKAIEIHEVNARRATERVYDQWVKRSFAALGKLQPARYAKAERAEEIIHAIR